jgi:transposase
MRGQPNPFGLALPTINSRRSCNLRLRTRVVTIGIDPGKNTLHLVGLDARGAIVLREKVARAKIVSRLANVPPCLIGIEASMGTHYVTRELLALDHDVRQVPPVYAKPFRQSHKNDFRDAHAIAEAVQRPTLLRPRNWMKHGFGPWLIAAAQRLHHNVLATALANKLARIAWSVLVQHREYEARPSGAAI